MLQSETVRLTTIFLGAFLLFQVQPILGRFVLPWFGGSPSVWTTCMLFFQAALLGGYLYAHWLGSWKDARLAGWLHTAVIAFSFLFLPIAPHAELWKPLTPDHPARQILALLTATVGVPYVVLASTAPLLQRWHSLQHSGPAPWRWYALSNFGSLLALLTYPFAIEPFFRLRTQSWIWSSVYVVFGGLCAWNALHLRAAPRTPETNDDPSPAPTLSTVLLWLGLAAAGSTLLSAVANEISQEVAVIPFLWIAPLALYLLSFVITFDHERWYASAKDAARTDRQNRNQHAPNSVLRDFSIRGGFAVAAGVLAPVACAVTTAAIGLSIWVQLATHFAALFAGCMICHGELVRSRPSARYLTAFYLAIAAGGVLGGGFTGVAAPRLFTRAFNEYPVGLAAACLFVLWAWLRGGALKEWTSRNFAVRVPLMALLLGGVSAIVAAVNASGPGVANVRNFYGLLRITEYVDPNGPVRQLTHGRIKHGFQYLAAKERDLPTSYYGPRSGVALAIGALARPRRIAVVGLGTGTIAAWGRAGDSIRFYEINPAVDFIAHTWFSFLNDSQARTEVTLGDARVQMERELLAGQSHDYDLIAVDAFSSDSIPIHLLTAECADLYRQRLAPGGVLAFHISNRALNLEPVVRGLAEHLGWPAGLAISAQDQQSGEDSSSWVLIAGSAEFLRQPAVAENLMGWSLPPRAPVLWTDDFASLWHVLK